MLLSCLEVVVLRAVLLMLVPMVLICLWRLKLWTVLEVMRATADNKLSRVRARSIDRFPDNGTLSFVV